DVADAFGAGVAIDQQRALVGDHGGGLAAVAGHGVHHLFVAALQGGVEERRAQLGAGFAGVVVHSLVRFRRLAGLVAAVEPGDAELAVGGRPHRRETVLGRGAVVVHQHRGTPVEAGVGGAAQGDVGGIAFAGLLQPVDPDHARGVGDVR